MKNISPETLKKADPCRLLHRLVRRLRCKVLGRHRWKYSRIQPLNIDHCREAAYYCVDCRKGAIGGIPKTNNEFARERSESGATPSSADKS